MVTNPSPALPTGTVIGRILFIDQDQSDANTEPDYSLINGTVKFICSVRGPIQVASQSTTLIPLSFDATFDSEGYLISQGDTALVRGIRLPATDSTVYNPSNFTWKVVFDIFDSTTGNQIRVDPFNIAVPSGGTVDLSTAMPVSEARGSVIIRGETGATGATPVLSIGTVTTGAPGSNASVTATGATPEAKTISFTIPRGDVGAPANITVLGTTTGAPGPTMAGPIGPKGDPGGIIIGTLVANSADYNTLTTDGVYRVVAPTGTTNGPPISYGVMYVNNAETPVGTRLVQTFYPGTVATLGRTIYQRGLAGGSWSAWRAINSSRVDQTAGRVVYQWDELNQREQVVYGDTGWRDVTADATWLAALSQANVVANVIHVRRINQTIHMRYGYNKNAAGSLTMTGATGLPTGWVPGGIPNAAFLGGDSGLTITRLNIISGSACTLQGPISANASLNVAWPTNDAWPTSLPGTAAGSIPNI